MGHYVPHDGGLFPTAEQTLVLRAALADAPTAFEAFYAWRAGIDLQAEFDRGTFRLMPLLYANLHRLGLHDSLMGRLKGTYRMAWCETNLLFERTRPVLSRLAAEGIPTLVVKGMALALAYYRNRAARPMADLDLVVRRRDVRRAIAILGAMGWRRNPLATDEDIDYRHSMQFFHPVKGELDLHWHLLFETCNDEADEHFWSAARTLDVDGVASLQLEASDMLVHTVLHGMRWNPEPPIRWIADAVMIIREGGIDWRRLVEFARAQKLTCRLLLGLEYLRDEGFAAIPPEVIEALRAAPISMTERLENGVVLRDRSAMFDNPILKHWVMLADYARCGNAHARFGFISGMAHYARYRWRLRGRGEMLAVAAKGLARRIIPYRYR